MAMTVEQQRALAVAAARKRLQEKQRPGTPEEPSPAFSEATAAASEASSQLKGGGRPEPSAVDAGMTWVSGFINGIPVVGPVLQNVSDIAVSEVGGRLAGEEPADVRRGIVERREARAEQFPMTDISGNLAGGVTSLGAAGAVPAGAEALGITGAKVLPRVIKSGVSGGGISAADTMVRGGDMADATAHGAVDAAISAAIPVVGKIISTGVKAGSRVVAPALNAVRNPRDEALRRVGTAVSRDRAANPAQMMTGADEAVARQAGVPVLNVDRAGETTRALARSVANQSPEARATINKAAEDRFSGQGQRAVEFIKRITGGQVDDLDYLTRVQAASRAANKPAYDAAYREAAARAIWSPSIRQLMQSPEFVKAVRGATRTGANEAAITGQKAVTNPFVFAADGSVTLKTMPDGSRALPNLEFWDVVQRNLRAAEEAAKRGAKPNSNLARQIGEMRHQLLAELDTAVPKFRQARQGAAFFFGAEDALDAGRKFATSPRNIPEARQALSGFNATERQAFAVGYASELIDRIKSVRDRTNVINQVFGNQSSREMIEIALGSGNAKRLEAYVRVEDLVDRLRGAMGNSTSVRQLMELGIGAGGGALFTGGDWKGALGGAALAKGGRWLGGKVDARVLQEIGKLLISDDPKLIQRAVARATMDDKAMAAVKALGEMLGGPARGAVVSGNEPTAPMSGANPPVPAPRADAPTIPPA